MDLKLLTASTILLYLLGSCYGRRYWNYEFLFVSGTSSDENLANVSLWLDRAELGKQTCSGVIDWKFDADENTMVKVSMLACQSGREEDYHVLPCNVPQITLYELLNKYYMKLVYSEFSSCSNVPHIEVPFVPPWNKKAYIFTRCMPPADAYPEMAPTGYYKWMFKIIGQVEISINVTLRLTPKVI